MSYDFEERTDVSPTWSPDVVACLYCGGSLVSPTVPEVSEFEAEHNVCPPPAIPKERAAQ